MSTITLDTAVYLVRQLQPSIIAKVALVGAKGALKVWNEGT